MRIDALTLALRPRTMGEAADLGQRLVQLHAGSVWRCLLPPWLAVMALALATLPMAPWAPTLVLFLAKPWLDRPLLFVLSRAVFGESTRPADLWRERQEVLLKGWLPRGVLARLSPWRAYLQAVVQLEGQRGAALRQRRRLLLAGRRGPALGLQLAYAHVELLLIVAAVSLLMWFLPAGLESALWSAWLRGGNNGLHVVQALFYGGLVLLLEPFHVAAGFTMYLNRRVELEAWDVEQELRHALA